MLGKFGNPLPHVPPKKCDNRLPSMSSYVTTSFVSLSLHPHLTLVFAQTQA